MTEDDTFRRLKREPLERCVNYYSLLTHGFITYTEFVDKLKEWYWEWHEFEQEYIMK